MIKIIEGSRIRYTPSGARYGEQNKENYEGTIHKYVDRGRVCEDKFYIKCPTGYVSGWFDLSYLDPENRDYYFIQVTKKPTLIIEMEP